MPTLKKYATQLADALGRPFDNMLVERLKDIIIQERATLIKIDMDKGRPSDYYTFDYECELEIVPSGEHTIIYGQDILKSVNAIPSPIGSSSGDPFLAVRTMGGLAIPYCRSIIEYINGKAFELVGGRNMYVWRNNYLYILGTLKPEMVFANGAYENPWLTLGNDEYCSIKATDETEFPMPMWMFQIVKERLLNKELLITDHKDKVTPTHIDNN